MEILNIDDINKIQDSKVIKKIPILTNQIMATILFIDANTNVPSHKHIDSDEIHYVIKGKGKITVGGEMKSIKEGMLILVPKTESHHFSTEGELLVILSTSPVCEPLNNIK